MGLLLQRRIKAVSLDFSGTVSRVRQEFQHSADINVVVDKFLRTGHIDLPNLARPVIDDATAIPGDFTEAAGMAYEQKEMELFNNENASSVDGFESGSEDDLQPVSKGNEEQGPGGGHPDDSGDKG